MTEVNRPVRGRNPYDEHILIVDFLELLLAEGVCKPKSVPMATVREWFPTRERHSADEIVDELAADSDAPLEYVTDIERTIWLVDVEATREYLADLRENPMWFDP